MGNKGHDRQGMTKQFAYSFLGKLLRLPRTILCCICQFRFQNLSGVRRMLLAVCAIAVIAINIFANSRGHAGLFPLAGYVRSNASLLLSMTGMTHFSYMYDQHLQLDMLCPVYQRDDKLKKFGRQLGEAIAEYRSRQPPIPATGSRIATFRLLLTRYGAAEQDPVTSKALQEELSQLTGLGLDQIVMIMVGATNKKEKQDENKETTSSFERASAVNQLQQAACHDPTCLVARIDVDMKVLPIFFDNAVAAVYDEPNGKAYFPIVWSEYYPLSAQLVEKHLLAKQQPQTTAETSSKKESVSLGSAGTAERTNSSIYTTATKKTDDKEPFAYKLLEEHSEHRGYWREHGTGMYCLSGPHARQFQLSEQFRGWGGEDGDYYQHVRHQLSKHRIARHNEPGLIHQWHPKTCHMGVDVMNDQQWKDCQGAKLGQMGSSLGQQLLQSYMRDTMPEDYQHHSILF